MSREYTAENFFQKKSEEYMQILEGELDLQDKFLLNLNILSNIHKENIKNKKNLSDKDKVFLDFIRNTFFHQHAYDKIEGIGILYRIDWIVENVECVWFDFEKSTKNKAKHNISEIFDSQWFIFCKRDISPEYINTDNGGHYTFCIDLEKFLEYGKRYINVKSKNK